MNPDQVYARPTDSAIPQDVWDRLVSDHQAGMPHMATDSPRGSYEWFARLGIARSQIGMLLLEVHRLDAQRRPYTAEQTAWFERLVALAHQAAPTAHVEVHPEGLVRDE